MSHFEHVLADVASRCEYGYGGMGRSGFLYGSVKDQLKWKNLSASQWVTIVMEIGKYLVLDDKTWEKVKNSQATTGGADISSALIAAFGDGKEKRKD